jgi:hypothetical protein
VPGEEPRFDALRAAQPERDSGGVRCVPTQVNAIRLWLHHARTSEAEILKHYKIGTLEELSKSTADQLLARLMEIDRQTTKTAG